MAIGRISGPMLFSNLERQGINLAFESNILYLDVNNRYLGANTITPDAELQVVGTAHLGDISIFGNSITGSTDVITLSQLSNLNVITQANIASINIYDQTITGIILDSDIVIAPGGAGNINANSTFITNVRSPLSQQDAATKKYVDDLVTTGISISGIQLDNTSIQVVDNGVNPGNILITVDGIVSGYFNQISSQLENIKFLGNTISSTVGNLNLQPSNISNGNSIVTISGVGAVDIPTGTTNQRPTNPTKGFLRFNTDLGTVEWYNGSRWVSGSNAITTQTITPDGINNTYTLTKETTAEGVLVNINGTIQQPTAAYTVDVSGLNITFNEVPLVTDIIEIRYISSAIIASTFGNADVKTYLESLSNVNIGLGAGISQGVYTIAIGFEAGHCAQEDYSVAVGYRAGGIDQLQDAVAVGNSAGRIGQSYNAVAVGSHAGSYNQLCSAVAIGNQAGATGQKEKAIAIGYHAGQTTQGTTSIAIGALAGSCNQADHSIILNATGIELDSTTTGFFVDPIRNLSSDNVLYYDSTTKEITYGTAPVTYSNVDLAASIATGTFAGNFTSLQASDVTTLTNNTDSTSVSSGALQVSGGLGVLGNVWIGGNLYVANVYSVTTNTLSVNDPLVYFQSPSPTPYNYDIGFYSDFIGGPVNIYGHTGVVRQQSANTWVFFSNINSEPSATGINWNDTGVIYDAVKAGSLTLANSTISTSTTTGALVVTGGMGIAGNINVGRSNGNSIVALGNIVSPQFNFANGVNILTTVAGTYSNANVTAYLVENPQGSTYSNANVVANLANFATTISTTANITTTANVIAPNYLFANGVNILSTVSGGSTYSNTNVAAYLTQSTTIGSGSTTSNLVAAATTVSTSITTGALVVKGGTGIAGNLWIGGNIKISGNTVSIGLNAGTNQAQLSVAIGACAGATAQKASGVAVGYQAGKTNQAAGAIAIGSTSGYSGQKCAAIAIGYYAGQTTQAACAIAIGGYAANNCQKSAAIAIGSSAGRSAQAIQAIAIGAAAGYGSQGAYSVAIGACAGFCGQKSCSVAVGKASGYTTQGCLATALGPNAGQNFQGSQAVAIGWRAAHDNQGTKSVAIGICAGSYYQGSYAVAIGYYAGQTSQSGNSIAINAGITALNPTTCGFFVNPVRNMTTGNVSVYNTAT